MDNTPQSISTSSVDVGVDPISRGYVVIETYRVVRPDGSYDADRVPDIDDDALRDLYRWMLLQRVYDDRATSSSGAAGSALSPPRGQEASIIGSGYALSRDD